MPRQPEDLHLLTALLSGKGLTISLAESCTGGMIASALTDVPGASGFFKGGAVVYTDEAKMRILGVDPTTLAEHGAVSEETALEMAVGALKAFRSDIALSVTGFAGPSGGTEDRPVGTVFVAVTDGEFTVSSENRFSGDREDVRALSVDAALRDALTFLERR